MTTSYPLSLRLKELGVPQEGGEYYWIQPGAEIQCCHTDSILYESWILCRALTLGEVVRELPDGATIVRVMSNLFLSHTAGASYFKNEPTPEEAAGELLAELKQKEG